MNTVKALILGSVLGQIWTSTGSLFITLFILIVFFLIRMALLPSETYQEKINKLDPNSKEYLSRYMPKV